MVPCWSRTSIVAILLARIGLVMKVVSSNLETTTVDDGWDDGALQSFQKSKSPSVGGSSEPIRVPNSMGSNSLHGTVNDDLFPGRSADERAGVELDGHEETQVEEFHANANGFDESGEEEEESEEDFEEEGHESVGNSWDRHPRNALYWSQLHKSGGAEPAAAGKVAVLITGMLRFRDEDHFAQTMTATTGCDVFVATYSAHFAVALRLTNDTIVVTDEEMSDERSQRGEPQPGMWQWYLLARALSRWRSRLLLAPGSYHTLVRFRTDLRVPASFRFSRCVGRVATDEGREEDEEEEDKEEGQAIQGRAEEGRGGRGGGGGGGAVGIVYAQSDSFFYAAPEVFYTVFQSMFAASRTLYVQVNATEAQQAWYLSKFREFGGFRASCMTAADYAPGQRVVVAGGGGGSVEGEEEEEEEEEKENEEEEENASGEREGEALEVPLNPNRQATVIFGKRGHSLLALPRVSEEQGPPPPPPQSTRRRVMALSSSLPPSLPSLSPSSVERLRKGDGDEGGSAFSALSGDVIESSGGGGRRRRRTTTAAQKQKTKTKPRSPRSSSSSSSSPPAAGSGKGTPKPPRPLTATVAAPAAHSSSSSDSDKDSKKKKKKKKTPAGGVQSLTTSRSRSHHRHGHHSRHHHGPSLRDRSWTRLFCGCKWGLGPPGANRLLEGVGWKRSQAASSRRYQSEPAMAYHILSHNASCLPLDLPHREAFEPYKDRGSFAFGVVEPNRRATGKGKGGNQKAQRASRGKAAQKKASSPASSAVGQLEVSAARRAGNSAKWGAETTTVGLFNDDDDDDRSGDDGGGGGGGGGSDERGGLRNAQ